MFRDRTQSINGAARIIVELWEARGYCGDMRGKKWPCYWDGTLEYVERQKMIKPNNRKVYKGPANGRWKGGISLDRKAWDTAKRRRKGMKVKSVGVDPIKYRLGVKRMVIAKFLGISRTELPPIGSQAWLDTLQAFESLQSLQRDIWRLPKCRNRL